MSLFAIIHLRDWLITPYLSQWDNAVHCALDELEHSRCPVNACGVTNGEDTVNERSSNIHDGMTSHNGVMKYACITYSVEDVPDVMCQSQTQFLGTYLVLLLTLVL